MLLETASELVRLTPSTKKRIDALKTGRETIDDVISRGLDCLEEKKTLAERER